MRPLMLFFAVFSTTPLLLADSGFVTSVTEEIERINSLRESLVHGVTDKPDQNTFKAVCAPVGKNLMALAKKKNWTVKQATLKPRRPERMAKGIEKQAWSRFEKNKNLISFFEKQGDKTFYFRRIDVKKECLACHGPKMKRPEFVKKGFPDDQAFGFKAGDLRGLYSVSKQ